MLRNWLVKVCFQLSVFFWAIAGQAQTVQDPLTLYIDADFTIKPGPARSIETGLRAALHGTWAEQAVRIVSRDHRTNPRRSLDNFRMAWSDPTAIAVIGGMHSPPYIVNGSAINAAHMPLLLPWSAGGRLTRFAQGEDNWIFRVSVDDTKSSGFLASSVARKGCQRTTLVVIDNGWGNGNSNRLMVSLAQLGLTTIGTTSLPIDSGASAYQETALAIRAAASDCVILVANTSLSIGVIHALAEEPNPPQVFSHWGILGQNLLELIDHDLLQRVQLQVLGTCRTMGNADDQTRLAAAIDAARAATGREDDPSQGEVIYGFFHAYDLGRLLLAALETARSKPDWENGADARRKALRDAFYQIDGPVPGLVKTYSAPFSPVTPDNPDGHEALGAQDLCMTTVDENGFLQRIVQG